MPVAKKPEAKHIAILWEDKDYLIVNKPAYFVTNAADDSIEEKLRKQEKNKSICAVHRLDKETSACERAWPLSRRGSKNDA